MDATRSLRWAGHYFLWAALATLVGGGMAVAGLTLGVSAAYSEWQDGGALTDALLAHPLGVALFVVGLAVWWFLKTWGMYRTLTGHTEEALSETYDTERVKSEVLTVLDERLADMQQDLNSINRSIRDLDQSIQGDAEDGDVESFEFGD